MPILVALVTGLVTVITVFLTGRGNLKLEREKFAANSKLERQKFEASLVLQAIATGERETAQKNLQFLVGAGFLPDPSGRIRDLETRPADVPVLPARRVAQSMPHAPVFRWSVRTGADPDASRVQDTPVRTTVEELAAQPRPTNMKAPTEAYPAYQERRAEGVETTIYEIEAVIVSHKLQTSGSYHLTLRGKSGQTMIANCVEPRLVGPTNRWAKQITTVRREVEQTWTPKQSMLEETGACESPGSDSSTRFTDKLASRRTAWS